MSRALISVSDKRGVVDLARVFVDAGIEVVSTGGTASTLEQARLAVTAISEVTGFPEVMDGRLKTLHPSIHGGLLAVRANERHLRAIADLGIEPIDYVIVNLYPFADTIADGTATLDAAIEQIDVGGPAMVRAAAKNFRDVVVVVDPADYGLVAASVAAGEPLPERERMRLAAKAFSHTAAYDAVVADYLWGRTGDGDDFPQRLTVTYEKVQDLRYGENPHQRAAFYAPPRPASHTIAGARQLHGKQLSYNNIADASAALAIVQEFGEPATAIVKHTNPCGVGMAGELLDAWRRAHLGDPVSAFGGVVAVNRTVDLATAELMGELFLEMVLAPGFDDDALHVLRAKPNVRLLEVDTTRAAGGACETTDVAGGMLMQQRDLRALDPRELAVATRRAPTAAELRQLLFAWKVVKHVKSNAVVLAREERTIGIGAGQMNRVGAARIAIAQAGEHGVGSVMASDAFFPMPDSVQAAAAAGVTAIIQPGGSRNDHESIAAADDADIAMVFTGVRHFRH